MDDILEQNDEQRSRPGWVRWGAGAALVAGGAIAGGLLAGSLTANAETPGATSLPAVTAPATARDEWKSMHPGEKLLTGATAATVRAAALARYPGATVLRVETDSDGVYEAHLVTMAGQRVTVEVGKTFAVTGTEDHGGGRGARWDGTGSGSDGDSTGA